MQDSTIPHPPQPDHSTSRKKEGWRSIASTVLILLATPLIALILTAFVFQSYEVEGPSMESTLQDRDRLIVWKLGKTWSNLANDAYIPKRGDIVIFHRPQNAGVATEGDKQLIKRVIALPGERVVVKDGIPTVFNAQHPNGYQPDQDAKWAEPGSVIGNNGDWTLSDNQVFVCGDNRNNSLDSRSFGPINDASIVGSLALRIYPFSKFDTF